MSDYDADISIWSERQGELLRRRATGELVNEAELDWRNIAEEIEALGKSDRRELRNRIATLLDHLIRLQASDQPADWLAQDRPRTAARYSDTAERKPEPGPGRAGDHRRRAERSAGGSPGLLSR